jgi:hypothetical protein
MRYPKPFYDACKIQKTIMQAIATIPTKDLGNVAKAYCSLEQLKLRIQMKPAPKAVDTTKLDAAKERALVQPSFVE